MHINYQLAAAKMTYLTSTMLSQELLAEQTVLTILLD